MYKRANAFYNTIKLCMYLSWKTSAVYTVFRVVFNIIIAVIPILTAYVSKRILDSFAIGNDVTFLFTFIILLTVLNLGQGIVGRCKMYIESLHAELMEHQCSNILLEKAIDADIKMYDTQQYYDIFAQTQNNMLAVTNILWNILEVTGSITAFVSAVAVISRFGWYYALAVIAASIPSAITGQKYTKCLYQNDVEQINSRRKQNYLFQVGTSQRFAQEIRCYRIGETILQKYKNIFIGLFQTRKKILSKRMWLNTLLLIVPEIVILVSSCIIAKQVLAGTYTIGDFSMYTSLLLQLNGTLAMMVMRIISVYENKMKADFIFDFSKITVPKIISGSRILDRIEKIEFDRVSFTYPGLSQRTLEDISFVLQKDRKTALIGKNGAGKSTLIKLLFRLYDVEEGNIFINDHNIKEYNLDSLRDQIGIYTQNSSVFDWTLGENISSGSDIYAEDECKRSLYECGGKDVLERCHGDLQTYLGRAFSEKGVELSIGQKQKVALARAFYKKERSAYVLDEPSSSLDPETEKKVFKSIQRLGEESIVLFTSHRIAAISMTDYVLVLEKGKIAERGTREELIAKKGAFYQLYTCQMGAGEA